MIYEKFEIGDIVMVDSYKYPNGSEGKYHYFVIITHLFYSNHGDGSPDYSMQWIKSTEPSCVF